MLTLLWPGMRRAWATMAATPVAWMRRAVDWLAHWPRRDVPVPPPPLWLIAAFYLLLLTAMLAVAAAGLCGGACARAGGALPGDAGPAAARGLSQLGWRRGETRVTLLAVGAGQCAVVQPPGGRTVLVDAGSSSLSDLVGKCIGPFLRHARCTEVDTIVMSHGDYDHISAADELVRGIRRPRGPRPARSSSATHAPGTQAEGLLAALDRMDRPPRLLAPGDRIPLGRDTTIEVLWPPPDANAVAAPTTPASSFKLTHAGRSILFPGDIQDLAMRELLRDPAKLKSDVLVAPHHGSSESLTAAFVRAVDPHTIVSSNDRTPTDKQRQFEHMIGSRPLYRTNRCGAITIVITRRGTPGRTVPAATSHPVGHDSTHRHSHSGDDVSVFPVASRGARSPKGKLPDRQLGVGESSGGNACKSRNGRSSVTASPYPTRRDSPPSPSRRGRCTARPSGRGDNRTRGACAGRA